MSGDQLMWKTPRHIFVRRDNVVVQIRGEAHSVEAFDAQEIGIRLARLQLRTGLLGALLIVEEGAPPPTGELAKRQRQVVQMFAADERIFVCLVLEGSGVGVTLKRALARSVFNGPRRHICGQVREGGRWLTTQLGEPEKLEELIAYVESLRW